MANESLSFELKLVDSVTSVAKRQAAAVKSVETSANKAQNALGKQFERVGFAAARAAHKQEQAFAASWAKIGMAAQRATERQKKEHERMAEKAKDHSMLSGFREATGLGRITKAAFLGDLLAEGAVKIGEALIESAEKVVDIITDGVKDAFKAAGKEQVQRIGEKISLGAGATGFREDAERFAGKTGFTSSEIRGLMLPSRNAGMSQAATRQSFATASDIAAGRGKGGSSEEVGGIMEQFQHIYTKKGIGKKQLVDLLGNVGSTIPDFYKSLGKQMKVSAKEAEKMSEEGKLDPQMLINMITSAQNKKQGGAAGTGAAEYAKSLEAHWHKIIELPDEYYRKLVDSPGFNRANEMLGQLLEKLDPDSPTGARIMAAIDSAFEKITGAFGGPEDAIDSIVDGIQNMISLVAEIIPDLKMMGAMLMASAETVADIIRGARLAIAISARDTDTVKAIVTEQAGAKVERTARQMAEQNEKNEKSRAAGQFLASFAMGGGVMLPSAKAEKNDGHWGDAPAVHVHMHGDHKDPETAGRKAGRAAARELERARQEGGG